MDDNTSSGTSSPNRDLAGTKSPAMAKPVTNDRISKRPTPKSAVVTCRTCGRCRTKKIKCDGLRPSCASCRSSNHSCEYLEDARRNGRPTKAEVESLRNEVALLRSQLDDQASRRPLESGLFPIANKTSSTNEHRLDVISPTSQVLQQHPELEPQRSGLSLSPQNLVNESPRTNATGSNVGPSSAETQVACAISEDGSVLVHGASSHLHHQSTIRSPIPREPKEQVQEEAQIQQIKDQLFANAALQRQRESSIFGTRGAKMKPRVDLDGLDPDQARHLLDIHFNRQHFAYLLTYRPAIMDSLANNGPYMNKLLLNAIYYSSCLYSDRLIFRANIEDPESMGEMFYLRFKELLAQEIDQPSLTNIAALLICGSTLVSNGKQSAGWILSGIAYRMVVDLGCHLSIPTRRTQSLAAIKSTAIEIEVRRRIYWGAFTMDKFQSLYLGRPATLRPEDARASKELLDYYEELEDWDPYFDPTATPKSTYLAGFQGPKPVFAISAFQSLVTLAEIAHLIASTFYAIDSVKRPTDYLLRAKNDIQAELNEWLETLPTHLHFQPRSDPTPPPNQINIHATYHTLMILLERPFLTAGHLSFATDSTSRANSEHKCVDAAIRIWHLVEAYKHAFTLRRAPYFLSYATYSAIVVILHQPNSDPQYVECIRFFWFALLDFQKGCTSGLRKPLKILQTLIQRLGKSVLSGEAEAGAIQQVPDDPQDQGNPPCRNTDATYEPMVLDGGFSYNERYEDLDLMLQNMEAQGWDDYNCMGEIADNEGFLDDSLYGLFTPFKSALQG